MLYAIIRILFGIAIIFLVVWYFKKRWRRTTKLARFFIGISLMVFITIFGLIPIENAFITFPSLQTAFNYSCVGEITDVIDGNNSCMVIYEKSNSSSTMTFFPKEGTGYKLGTIFSFETIYSDNYGGLFIKVHRVKGTWDYYVSLLGIWEGDLISMTDSAGSNFIHNSEVMGDTGYTSINSHAFVDSIDDGYSIQINDTKIQISP